MGDLPEVPEVPFSAILVNLEAPWDQLVSSVRLVCKEVVPGWSGVPIDQLEVSKISGGITNILLMVKPEVPGGNTTEPVTVRVFGPSTDIVIDRKREWQAIKCLSAAGFGANLIGSFKNGVVQSFIHARTLEPRDMSKPEIVRLIARSVRQFHEVAIPGPRDPQLWPTIDKYLNLAVSLSFEDPAKRVAYERLDFAEIKRELAELQEVCATVHSPVVFAHNDLLSGNFMLDEHTGKLYVIDYEYGAYSFRGFDIGNHFNEYAGFEGNYTLYPDRAAQYRFYREYLSPQNPEKVEDEELEAIYVESNCFALASHLYWAVWALVQARYSSIEFDYLEYFSLRFDEYKRRKEEFLALARERNAKVAAKV